MLLTDEDLRTVPLNGRFGDLAAPRCTELREDAENPDELSAEFWSAVEWSTLI